MLTELFKVMLSIPSAWSPLQVRIESIQMIQESAFGGFQNIVESQSVQCPVFRVDAFNSVQCFSSGTIRKCDIKL
jgi:hypothetical protein